MPGDLPQFISTYGADIDGLIRWIWWVSLGWLALSEAALFYLVIRYRRVGERRASWLPGEGWAGYSWILVPAAIILAFDLVIDVKSNRVWNQVKVDLPEHELLVRITARQFAWNFTYAGADGVLDTDDDLDTTTYLRVPTDRVVRYQLESKDVLHSFWVPALMTKHDVVPGRSIPGWFEVEEEGQFDIACAEICGASHTAMKGHLVAQTGAEFDSWLQQLAEQKTLLAGRQGS